MKYVIELLEKEKEENESILESIEDQMERGAYRTNNEVKQAESAIVKLKEKLSQIDTALEKLNP